MRRLAAGVAAACLALAAPAWAEVCDTERPGWDGTPATPLSEAIHLFLTPAGVLLLVASAAVIRFRSQWGALAVVLGWAAMASVVIFAPPLDIDYMAMQEGCVGQPTLFAAGALALSIGMVWYTAPRKNEDG